MFIRICKYNLKIVNIIFENYLMFMSFIKDIRVDVKL